MKIDRAFIRNIGNDEGGTDMVAAIIHLARALRMQVVALGVDERPAQLAILNTLGCDSYQGALFLRAAAGRRADRTFAGTTTRFLLSNHEDPVDE
jgi:EAL domain-containing protein (putative c-di-GMP-specific phosphodiesterase class I)